MNESQHSDAEAIRSDIDDTRRRMDDTMDELGDRLQPRHLVDEFLGYLRGNGADGQHRMTRIKDKVSRSAETAMHSVVDTVKENPLPALLIGAGVGWMIYESMRDKSSGSAPADGNYYGYSREGEQLGYDPDQHYDRPLEYPPSLEGTEAEWSDQGGSKLGEMKDKIADQASEAKDKIVEKASSAKEQVKEKLSQLGEATREKASALKERAGEMAARAKDRTREAYVRTRERVVTTADQHPLEVGLVALAAGVLVGLALPTPAPVNRAIGPTADRLRDRTRRASGEMLEKGKRVARAAMTAVKDEAQAQGLTPDRLREKATAVADRGMEAGQDTARQEGLTPEGNQSGYHQTDPSKARPAV